MKEIETKIIDIDEKSLRKTLKGKAEYTGRFSMKRYVFYIKADRRIQEDEFIRIRTDGKRTTLTYKHRKGKGLDNTEELETEVSDFELTREILSKVWPGKKAVYQESRLEKWTYKGVSVEIHTWPLVPSFVEVEGSSEDDIRRAINELGITGTELGNTNLAAVFDRYKKHGLDAGDLRFSDAMQKS